MVRFLINKAVFNYILLYLLLQLSGHGALENSIELQLNFKLFFSRSNFLDKLRSERKSENIANIPQSENCENINILLEEYKKGSEIPSLEEIVEKLGYPIEKYIVQTDDGYLLTVFRIKHGKNGQDGTTRKLVFLQHGVLESAAEFLATPTGMAYYLADKGYDVWIGNSRGTTLSRRHVDEDKGPDKKGTKFWKYSFHEMGVFDLPAVLRTIRQMTGGNQRIHYVGMSMGSTQFLVMASEEPAYLDWIDCVILMGPVAIPKHMTLASGINYFIGWVYFMTRRGLTDGEVCIHRAKVSEAVYKFCSADGIKKKICKSIMMNVSKPKTGKNLYDFENTVPVYLFSPAGSSVMTFLHYLQIVNSGKFQKFDYGKTKNQSIYKSKNPPEYNLKNIKKKLFLMVGGADDVAVKVDVLWLQSKLPSSEIISEKFESFTHRDFHHSVDIEETLYDTILDKFTEWESKKEDGSG